MTPALIRLCKKLLKHFGIPFHTAPGEAEAECAALQQAGVIDAVMSEDVDTLMFGATVVLRDWSALKGTSAKIPTHISVYESRKIKEENLDRQGMVLIALMHGGDYLPEGLAGCGIRTALDAAKAGFGAELCRLFDMDADEYDLEEWRDKLQRELQTNQSRFFRTKNSRITIPPDWPSMEHLQAYYKPIVSDPEKIERIKELIVWDADAEIPALREYTRATFEWRGSGGASKFVRTLAPALMARWALDGTHDIENLVEGLHGMRKHDSTDNCPEVRISFIPSNVIPVDKVAEAEDDELEATEQRGLLEDDEGNVGEDNPIGWTPDKLERLWVLEEPARKTLPELFDAWDNKKKPKPRTRKVPAPKLSARSQSVARMEQSMEKFLNKTTGNTSPPLATQHLPSPPVPSSSAPPVLESPQPPSKSTRPPAYSSDEEVPIFNTLSGSQLTASQRILAASQQPAKLAAKKRAATTTKPINSMFKKVSKATTKPAPAKTINAAPLPPPPSAPPLPTAPFLAELSSDEEIPSLDQLMRGGSSKPSTITQKTTGLVGSRSKSRCISPSPDSSPCSSSDIEILPAAARRRLARWKPTVNNSAISELVASIPSSSTQPLGNTNSESTRRRTASRRRRDSFVVDDEASEAETESSESSDDREFDLGANPILPTRGLAATAASRTTRRDAPPPGTPPAFQTSHRLSAARSVGEVERGKARPSAVGGSRTKAKVVATIDLTEDTPEPVRTMDWGVVEREEVVKKVGMPVTIKDWVANSKGAGGGWGVQQGKKQKVIMLDLTDDL